MADHEHRPTVWKYLYHLDKTSSKNWTGKHTLVCKHCGMPITRRPNIFNTLLIAFPALSIVALYKMCREIISNRLIWLAIIFGTVVILSILDFHTVRYQILAECNGESEAK